jgi:two-component system, NarL family, response regulator NreC
MIKTIILADDHEVVRAGLAMVIKKYTRHTIVAEVGDGLETVKQARLHQPDLIIMDIGMPGLHGLEAVSQIKKFLPRIKILILSIHRDKKYVVSALRLGVSGYLLKSEAVDELVEAIGLVLEGKHYISPDLQEIVADELMAPGRGIVTSRLDELSDRERQVLILIAAGTSRGDIAKKLFISTETVKTHRKNIMRKLHLHKHAELIAFALGQNLGPIPE